MSTSVKKSRRKLHAKPALLIPTAQVDSPRTALRRCLRAWQRVIDSDFAESYDDVSPSARVNAAHAWCEAMPMLDGPQGVRCYLACVAHGLLIGAIPPNLAGHLLYAAQVAQSSAALKSVANARESVVSPSLPPKIAPPTPAPPQKEGFIPTSSLAEN